MMEFYRKQPRDRTLSIGTAWRRVVIGGLLLFFLAWTPLVAGFAQETAPQGSTAGSEQQSQKAGDAAKSEQKPGAQTQQSGKESQPVVSTQTKISPQEAEELFREVDEILRFASKDSGLPIRHEVKRRLVDRGTVEAYVSKETTHGEDAKRLQRAELVLKKFGLLPRDFDLGKFLVALLKEQVAGYYDSKTRTVNLLDWVGPEQQRPVLAHELTHALQDQSFGLEKWLKASDVDLNKKKEVTPADIETDELSTVRQAVVEGQAMAVLVDYMLAPMGASLLKSPEVVSALKEGMLVGTADSVEFQNAPIYMKEALTFPYRYGLDFTAALLGQGGKQKAFAGAFTEPPRTTRQIMEPQTYLSGEHIDPLPLPDFKQDFKNYDRFDVGAMGEFDVAILVDQYAGVEASHKVYPHWRGGYYYAVRPKGDAAAPLAVLYVSRWSSDAAAQEFAAIYARSLEKRYRRVSEVAAGKTEADPPIPDALNGDHTWLTEEGDVIVDVHGDEIMITESLDQPMSANLEREIFAQTATAEK